jgi:hypothetical protein
MTPTYSASGRRPSPGFVSVGSPGWKSAAQVALGHDADRRVRTRLGGGRRRGRLRAVQLRQDNELERRQPAEVEPHLRGGLLQPAVQQAEGDAGEMGDLAARRGHGAGLRDLIRP